MSVSAKFNIKVWASHSQTCQFGREMKVVRGDEMCIFRPLFSEE